MQSQPYLDPRLAGVYDQGSAMPDSSQRAWAELIGSFSPVPCPAVLDLGAGTGMFALALARWCGASQSAPPQSRGRG
jgi:ubiquinone/menaquinone biosynthesis C-methylase UbiE